MTSKIELLAWAAEGFDILERNNTIEQTSHLGGPETPEKLVDRNNRYLKSAPGTTEMFRITSSGQQVGSIGYWKRDWNGEPIYETGWAVIPEFQGQGIASHALLAMIEILKPVAQHPHLHAFPSVENAPSNGVCRKAGFLLVGECQGEYPPGHFFTSNDWRLDLSQ